MPDPHSIYQDWLDTASAALMDGNVEEFVSMASLPFIQRTSRCETVLEDRADLWNDVENVVQALKGEQVTHYIRLVKKARYLDEDAIEGWHTTYVLRNATAVTPTYGNRMILRKISDSWKVTEADHELSGDRFPVMVLRSDPGSFEKVWRGAKADISATHARAEPIYQVFIDSMSEAMSASDFASWCEHFTFPYDIHFDDTDIRAERPEDIRAFFDMITDQIRDSGADRMIRSARYAEFLSDDRIFGYHDAIIVKGDDTIFGPVKSRMMLIHSEGQWRCNSVTNSLSENDRSQTDFGVLGDLPTMRKIQERMRK
ncbi:MAG: hypothetical protein JKY00_10930 [Roseicyclus sp.]|nr:hypothetical protein [Roseicyclus sp.]